MKKEGIIVLLISFLFTSYALADADVNGWKKIKWGMSKGEISKIYDIQPNADGEIFLTKTFIIQKQEFSVKLGFNENNIIDIVSIRPKDAKLLGNKYLFRKLTDILTNKYGLPSITKTNSLGPYNTWEKPSGRIEIQYCSRYYWLFLSYYPPPKDIENL